MVADITYRRWDDPIAKAAPMLLALCEAAFGGFDEDYLLARLPHMTDPDLWLAEAEGRPVAFKLGYRRGAELLYSWLGGVAPEARRQGVAAALMVCQHTHALAMGYRLVETRTRAANNPMLLLNLSHGFQVCGYEVDARGIAIVLQRKVLA
jgi:GNAT superfamily N-acetyltransferase